MTQATTTTAINQSSFGLPDIWGGLVGLGQAYFESRTEPAPVLANPSQSQGVDTTTLQTPQGANLANQPTTQQAGMNKYLMWGGAALIGLVLLLVILKLVGVI